MATAIISSEKFCTITTLTERRLRQIATAGYFPPPIKGQWQAAAVLIGFIKYQAELISKKSDTLRQEQEAFTKAKREMAEFELTREQGEYIKRDIIGPALRNISLHQRAVLQRKLEQELAPNIAGLTTEQVLVRVRAAVTDICAVFHDGVSEWVKAPPK